MIVKSDTHNLAKNEVEKHWPQVLVILVSTLGGLTDGLFFSWTSPYQFELVENKEVYDISEEEVSFFNTVYPIGMIIGAPIFSTLSDRIGRKKTYSLTVIPQILSWLLAAFAQNVYYFYVSRLLAGFSIACAYAVLPTYIGETAHPTVRGTWGNALASMMYFGELFIHIIGLGFNVKGSSLFCLAFPIIFLILFSMMPESPYYYIMKGQEEEAKKSLRFLTRKQDVSGEYKILEAAVYRQISESGSWLDLFKITSNRKAIVAASFLRLSQYFSGLGVFLQYTQVIFQKSGGNISSQTSAISYMTLNTILNFIVIYFIVDKFQRKTLYVASLIGCGLTLYVLGTYFYIDEYLDVDLSSVNWMPATAIVLNLICSSIGVAFIPTLMLSELFSTKITAKATAILTNIFALGIILTNTLYYYIETYFGFYAPFYFFAICNTISTIIGFYVIPETKGKTLEEIQLMLKSKKEGKIDTGKQCEKY